MFAPGMGKLGRKPPAFGEVSLAMRENKHNKKGSYRPPGQRSTYSSVNDSTILSTESLADPLLRSDEPNNGPSSFVINLFSVSAGEGRNTLFRNLVAAPEPPTWPLFHSHVPCCTCHHTIVLPSCSEKGLVYR